MVDPRAVSFTFTTDNSISISGIDVAKLNQVASAVQNELMTGLGDYCEEGSRGDIRHLQMPKFFQLLEGVHALNTILPKILTAINRENGSEPETPAAKSREEGMLGGKTKTLTAQVQTLQEQFEKMLAKNGELETRLGAITIDAEEARKQTEALQQESETHRKDIVRLEKKVKEAERRGPSAVAVRLEEQMNTLQREADTTAAYVDQQLSVYEQDHGPKLDYIFRQLDLLASRDILISNWYDPAADIAPHFEELTAPNPVKVLGLCVLHNCAGQPAGFAVVAFYTVTDTMRAIARLEEILAIRDDAVKAHEIYYPRRHNVRPGDRKILMTGLTALIGSTIKQTLLALGVISMQRSRAEGWETLFYDDKGQFGGQALIELED
ncbi:hypothetical protein CLAFUW4_14380 [Fulvia fulva]|uniref:Uncharacterized protein n=1 Tax=Passalora fulva TaxID=5499 RepID=A0A9Q8PM95_PASFU|nr:uncharacterized protein CLAFUR5_14211 [Fulvia fulva]KAK4608973.1 hypothetical protein CLAFUR4_14376 [Fulvia fulva]KAK4609607.1 hypothetical protein CLAFUR0_14381 [Fulvia fulva]UJO25036.1 hypothetical protein CLAFUR5_14211 [Fulvia fulva]WPV22873.1 hypothetical protein CLAFUW4_14380 [Fulvia fulva]WPV37883.1 hypothetical protein CLAFUW7_14385 [Fulvia fulva]